MREFDTNTRATEHSAWRRTLFEHRLIPTTNSLSVERLDGISGIMLIFEFDEAWIHQIDVTKSSSHSFLPYPHGLRDNLEKGESNSMSEHSVMHDLTRHFSICHSNRTSSLPLPSLHRVTDLQERSENIQVRSEHLSKSFLSLHTVSIPSCPRDIVVS